jgi:hypothetical protein
MKKYKLLRFGRCYINKAGDFAIALIRGDKKHGYQFLGSHAHTSVMLGNFQLLSRIVPNDGNWIEIDEAEFSAASAFHVGGYAIRFGMGYPIVSKY